MSLCDSSTNFTLGVMVPLGCDSVYSPALPQIAAELAIENINADTNLLDGFHLDYELRNSNCSATDELVDLVKLLTEIAVDAIVGPIEQSVCEPVARLASRWTLPVVSWMCTDDVLSDSSTYKTFSRTVTSNSRTYNALSATLLHFQWKYSVMISIAGTYWLDLAKDIVFSLQANDLIVTEFLILDSEASQDDIISSLNTVSSVVKAIIMCIPSRSMDSADQENVMLAAKELGMTDGLYAFFSIDTLSSAPTDGDYWFEERDDSDTLREAYEALFILTVQPVSTLSYNLVLQQYLERIDSSPFKETLQGYKVSTQFGQVYDAIYVLAYAINRTLTAHGNLETINGLEISNFMKNLNFEGLSGNVNLDENGDRTMCYILLDYDKEHGAFQEVLRVNYSSDDVYQVTAVSGVSINWPNDVVLSPDADCMFIFEGCDTDDVGSIYIIAIGVSAVLFACLSIGFYHVVRRWSLKHEMVKGPNKILLSLGDLQFESPNKILSGSRKLLDPDKESKLNGSKALSPSPAPTSHVSPEPRMSRSSNICIDMSDLARYNGEFVRVKKLTSKYFDIKNSTIRILRQIRDLRHENINPFQGCYKEPQNTALVTEYCNKGSLEDVINSENIKLDWMFKSSLLLDLVSGMKYLHNSPIKLHGRLNSRNCVIDSRWVLKITDYDLPALIETQTNYPEEQQRTPEDLLWSAPEMLRDPVLRKKGTPKADVYSFAIIVSELLTRDPPFAMLSLTPKEIIAKVKKPPPLCRPSVSQNDAPREVIEIMKQCWAESPDMRPDFNMIYQLFKKLNQGRKTNIVDSMFKMLEKYSNHLEDLIRDRTKELAEEKKKTDKLLYRMMPATVAESLKLGRPIEAETFSEVTIFFSDIVGFTSISAMSTPLQVVDFLNDLYTMFDDILSNYDCYKVETIGDAYMVVSGLPIRNGNRHAGEISTLALDLLHAAGFKFKIRHMPEKPLKLRIGLHTGPCVAGVVGLTMPRYCLFGDTVNTASRMESTGQACRIHISESVSKKLDELGAYYTEPRGEVVLKGKGVASTHWLVGKQGFEKPLPEYRLYQDDNTSIPVPSLPSTSTSHGTSQVSIRSSVTIEGETREETSSRPSELVSTSTLLVPSATKAKTRKRSVVSSFANMMTRTFGMAAAQIMRSNSPKHRNSTSCAPMAAVPVSDGLMESNQNSEIVQSVTVSGSKKKRSLENKITPSRSQSMTVNNISCISEQPTKVSCVSPDIGPKILSGNISSDSSSEPPSAERIPSPDRSPPTIVRIVQDYGSNSSSETHVLPCDAMLGTVEMSQAITKPNGLHSLQVDNPPLALASAKKQSNDSGAYFDSPPPSPLESTEVEEEPIAEERKHSEIINLLDKHDLEKGVILSPKVKMRKINFAQERLHGKDVDSSLKHPRGEQGSQRMNNDNKPTHTQSKPTVSSNISSFGVNKKREHCNASIAEKGRRKPRTQKVYGHRVIPLEKRKRALKS
ncbi:retinal guanylyl cyclase 2-like [Saccoglossus kowalevskii]